MDDSQLIIGCKKKNRDAQKALYEAYAPKMMAVCLRYCRNDEVASDLLHDGFIQVFTRINTYKGKGSFEGWLRRIFVNVALDYFRQEQKKYKFQEEYQYFLSSEEDDELQDTTLEITEISHDEVMQLIRELPPGYRAVFNMFVFEEMSHREIGKILGINEAASRSQFFRAKTLLKKNIEIKLKKDKTG